MSKKQILVKDLNLNKTNKSSECDKERAVAFVCEKYLPIQDIIIGITNTVQNYKCFRNASKRYTYIEYIIEGNGKILTKHGGEHDESWQNFTKGECLILRQNDLHSYYTEGNFKKIWVSFSSYYIDQMLDGYGIFTGKYSANVYSNFQIFLDCMKYSADFNDLFFVFSNNLHQIILSVAAELSKSIIDPVITIKNQLINSIYNKCSMDELAKKIAMSKSNLIRKFKQETGLTPYDFLLGEKIRTGESLLKTTSLKINEIADLLCFTDEHYFSYIFRKKVGLTPSDYRRHTLKNIQNDKSIK